MQVSSTYPVLSSSRNHLTTMCPVDPPGQAFDPPGQAVAAAYFPRELSGTVGQKATVV